ncbi:MAG TPA: glycosyltransferase family 4 protein [Solirubrobacterales bacterium]|nr:glycosyltransferase family 4 protein [Solirubrobacterales bacterium]
MNGLQWRLTATRRLWAPGAVPSQPLLEPDRTLREPHGKIDFPKPGKEIGPLFEVLGWALFPNSPTASVEVTVGGKALGRARLGLSRPDVRAHWDLDHAGSSGFQMTVLLPDAGIPKGEAEIEVVATSLDGERLLLEPVVVEVDPDREEKEDKVPAPAPRTPLQRSALRPHVVVFTHQLNLGGGQLYLLDLLKQMVRDELASFTLVSTLDGSLRTEIEELDIPVHITGPTAYDDLSSHVGQIEELIAWMEGRDFDAAFVNTATLLSTPGVEAAQAMGLPVLWAIHESFSPTFLWANISPAIRERTAAAMKAATTLIFEAKATQRLFEPVAGPDRCTTIPYGLDLTPIEKARRTFNPAAARREEGIPADAELIVCVGTIEPRKAQLMLAHAFDVIAPRHPRAHLAFVGGKDDLDSEYLEEAIEHAKAGERMRLIPVTPEVERWYGMADLFVSASDVESLPKTVLEAMVWETPVLATNVFGLPELITDGETGWLCESRDLKALITGLTRALDSTPEERRQIGKRSRALVEERHSLPKYASEIASLVRDAIAKKPMPSVED